MSKTVKSVLTKDDKLQCLKYCLLILKRLFRISVICNSAYTDKIAYIIRVKQNCYFLSKNKALNILEK